MKILYLNPGYSDLNPDPWIEHYLKILKNSVFDNLYNTIAQNGDLQKKATQAFANTLTINPKKIDFTKKMPLVLKDVFHQMRYITPHPLFTDEPHGTAARHAYDKLATFLEKSDQ